MTHDTTMFIISKMAHLKLTGACGVDEYEALCLHHRVGPHTTRPAHPHPSAPPFPLIHMSERV